MFNHGYVESACADFAALHELKIVNTDGARKGNGIRRWLIDSIHLDLERNGGRVQRTLDSDQKIVVTLVLCGRGVLEGEIAFGVAEV